MNKLHSVAMGLVGLVAVFVVGCGAADPSEGRTDSTSDPLSTGPGVPGQCKAAPANEVMPPGIHCNASYYVSNGDGTAEVAAYCLNNSATQAWVAANANVAPWFSYFGVECQPFAAPPGYVWVSYDPTCPSCRSSM